MKSFDTVQWTDIVVRQRFGVPQVDHCPNRAVRHDILQDFCYKSLIHNYWCRHHEDYAILVVLKFAK